MKATARFKDMSVDELRSEEQSLVEQLFKLRFQKAIGQLENSAKVRQVRKDLARVKTFITQREAGAEQSKAKRG